MNSDSFLLIDDDPAIGRLIKRAAESCGYTVYVTSDPDSFEQLYTSVQPGLIAVDLAMPGIDGIEHLRRLADADCEAAILIISGFDQRVLDTALRLGDAFGLKMVGKIPKPVSMERLRTIFTEIRQAA